MIVKEFKPKKALWGFKVDFVSISYGSGYDLVRELLGPIIKADDDTQTRRWFMEADVPYPFTIRAMKSDPHSADFQKWRKARIYVNDDDLAMLLRLMCV